MQIKQFFLSFLLCLASPDLDPNVSKLQKHAKHERERERDRMRDRERERDREKTKKIYVNANAIGRKEQIWNKRTTQE